MSENKVFAKVVGGSLSKGVDALILKSFSTEQVRAGSMVVIEGRENKYLGVVFDVEHLGSKSVAGMVSRETVGDAETANLRGKVLSNLRQYGKLPSVVKIVPIASLVNGSIEQADTLPYYMASTSVPSQEDIFSFYGEEEEGVIWSLGVPKLPLTESKIDVHIPINVDVLTRGSFGIFGKSGTGKTFLGNIIAAYIVASNYSGKLEKKVKLLIFDMHSEYGLMVKDTVGRDYATGVGQVFSEDFIIYTPDMELAKNRGLREFKISVDRVTGEDIAIAADAFGLTKTYVNYLPTFEKLLRAKFKKDWLKALCGLLGDDENQAAEEIVRSDSGVAGLRSFRAGRSKLRRFEGMEFIDWRGIAKDSADEIVEEITSGERSVIISFGRYGDDKAAYMLIANIIARRLWEKYVELAMEGGKLEYRVVIFLEEAHKFLGPETYYMTPFGNIARELRKRGVVLCIIDQRPSQIFEDVRGMLWNYFVMLLTEDSDIDVCTKGLPYPKLFKPVVQQLRRQEVLVYGEAINVPAVLKIVDYRSTMDRLAEKYRNALIKKGREIDLLIKEYEMGGDEDE